MNRARTIKPLIFLSFSFFLLLFFPSSGGFQIYSSSDFVHWDVASGGAAIFDTAECPDFFPLPATCTDAPMCQEPPAGTVLPTHVHKQSSGGQDWYTLGVYTDGAAGTTGVWTPVRADLQPLDASQYMNAGMQFYASKSFHDPAGDRRIYYGWALVPPASTQTLPRVTTYHAGLQRLLFNPLPELADLRIQPPLYLAESLSVSAGQRIMLGTWAAGAGNQSELRLTFRLPEPGSAATFGVTVGAAASGYGGTNITLSRSADGQSISLNVGAQAPPMSFFMPGVDLPGGDYNVTDVNYTDPHICQAVCAADKNCMAYTYVTRPPLAGSCCLKGTVPAPNPNSKCTSGVKPGVQPAGAPLPLLPGEDEIDLVVYVDNTFLEVFAMGGRLAVTMTCAGDICGEGDAAAMGVFATGADISVADITAWRLDTIWTTPDLVLSESKKNAQ
jgi:hypothetical protein